MNLYLILAIAFGTISGATEAPVGRRASASIVTARSARAAVIRAANRVILSREDGEGSQRPSSFTSFRMTWSPLTGGATPRAPAVNC